MTPEQQAAIREAAIAYARAGFLVVQLYGVTAQGACNCRAGADCPSPGKHPIGTAWEKRATSDPALVAGLYDSRPESNVGLRLRGTGQAVLDEDTPEGAAALARLVGDLGGPLASAQRGDHHYVSTDLPPGVLLPGLELKSDMVVVPPSVNADASVRAWAPGRSLLECPLPPLPEALVGLLGGRKRQRAADTAEGQRVPHGERREALRSHAAKLRNTGLGEAAILDGLRSYFEHHCEPDPPASEGDLEGLAEWAAGLSVNGDYAREATGAPPAGGEEPVPPLPLAKVLAVYEKWLYLEDTDAVVAALGAYAANLLPGDPVWLLIVAPPGWGKTEAINPLAALPDVHAAATLTEASLLSGTPKREAKDAKGGLLNEIGAFGVILCKDFTSILSMHTEARASTISALREVYDGAWTRHVGSDGGRTLSWKGKVGLIAGCTPTIDNHHGVMAAMGPRFVLYRMPEIDETRAARAAIVSSGREEEMRRELSLAVRGLFAGEPTVGAPPTDGEIDRIILLARLAARSRSDVERDGYHRDIELVPGAESPTRLAKVLTALLGGMTSIGADRATAWRIVGKVALDCIPTVRRGLLAGIGGRSAPALTRDLASALGYPTTTAKRALEDLACYGLSERIVGGSGKGDRWTKTGLLQELWPDFVTEKGPKPEKPVDGEGRVKSDAQQSSSGFSGLVGGKAPSDAPARHWADDPSPPPPRWHGDPADRS